MADQLLAYCGLDCSQCPAYIATQADDIPKLTSLAQEWFDGSTDHTLILCDGCRVNGGGADHRIMLWCGECPTRACAIDHGLENCAFCDDYGCQKLGMVFEQSQDAKNNLERIRATLG
jgi:hypothetical protein